MEPQTQQSSPPQTAEYATPNVGRRHIMPGLIPILTEAFLRPRKHYTVRAVADDQGVEQQMVLSAILHDLYSRYADLSTRAERAEQQVNRLMLTVREYRQIDQKIRRVA